MSVDAEHAIDSAEEDATCEVRLLRARIEAAQEGTRVAEERTRVAENASELLRARIRLAEERTRVAEVRVAALRLSKYAMYLPRTCAKDYLRARGWYCS